MGCKKRVNTSDFTIQGWRPVNINKHLFLSPKKLLGQVNQHKDEKQ